MCVLCAKNCTLISAIMTQYRCNQYCIHCILDLYFHLLLSEESKTPYSKTFLAVTQYTLETSSKDSHIVASP